MFVKTYGFRVRITDLEDYVALSHEADCYYEECGCKEVRYNMQPDGELVCITCAETYESEEHYNAVQHEVENIPRIQKLRELFKKLVVGEIQEL